MKKIITTTCVVLLTISQYACAPLIIVGAAAAVTTATIERRTPGTVIEDQTIEFKINDLLGKDEGLKETARVRGTSYNNIVLLTGETPNENLRERAASIARKVNKVSRVHNEITVGDRKSFGRGSNDTWITTKVKTAITSEKDLNPIHVKVVTEKGTVFLMGILERDEGQRAALRASKIKGVKRVVKIFEYLD
ncbi:MAG: BON domain-containing protein [Gammaproteobacteria bacterium]|nr:BON domain-containing protein [Gammaproteobacteria bacterium]PCH62473.1 MAG: BON domain-containing protein [Gammaproteobacteria bacterium]